MGMFQWCNRKIGWIVCNGDCYWCDRYKEGDYNASAKSEGRVPVRENGKNLHGKGCQSESRETGKSNQSQSSKEEKVMDCPYYEPDYCEIRDCPECLYYLEMEEED